MEIEEWVYTNTNTCQQIAIGVLDTLVYTLSFTM
jgi:hypothetical protein